MKNRLSNGPLRAQSKAKAEYSATFGTRKLSGICLYPVKCMASAMNQGGTTDKSIIRPWQRFSSFCQGLFCFMADMHGGIIMVLLTKRWRSLFL